MNDYDGTEPLECSGMYIYIEGNSSDLLQDVNVCLRHSPNVPASTFSRGYSFVHQSES